MWKERGKEKMGKRSSECRYEQVLGMRDEGRECVRFRGREKRE